jgi:hypothetical protein
VITWLPTYHPSQKRIKFGADDWLAVDGWLTNDVSANDAVAIAAPARELACALPPSHRPNAPPGARQQTARGQENTPGRCYSRPAALRGRPRFVPLPCRRGLLACQPPPLPPRPPPRIYRPRPATPIDTREGGR